MMKILNIVLCPGNIQFMPIWMRKNSNLLFLKLAFLLIGVYSFGFFKEFYKNNSLQNLEILYENFQNTQNVNSVKLNLGPSGQMRAPFEFSENRGLVDTIVFCTARTAKWPFCSDASIKHALEISFSFLNVFTLILCGFYH